jgi:hypothetical protein
MEADYNERLKSALIGKVAPLIKRVAAESRFQDQILKERPAFLRTKAFYESCMSLAEAEYGWQRLSFRWSSCDCVSPGPAVD